MIRKKLLFTIDSLTFGGAEKSLVTLLNLLDYSKYDVDLQLFAYGGMFTRFLPKEVNLLPPFEYSLFLQKNFFVQLKSPKKFFARLRYSLLLRQKGLLHADKARLYWQSVKGCFSQTEKEYDVAIAYAQGVPTFYTVDKVHAKKKVAWVNVDYRLNGKNLKYQRKYYARLDAIAPVSQATLEVFQNVYPEFVQKMFVVYDINDAEMINRLSEFPAEKLIDHSKKVVMTTGRLNYKQKGYDIALEAAKILKGRGEIFCWYAVGDGPERPKMESFIKENDLGDVFILLGATPNPYAYMAQCDVYVQTSRHEGFGLTIAEARILNKPVVCTNFDGCTKQMINEKNGLVVDIDAKTVADGVQRLLHDSSLYDSIKEYLKTEKKGNLEELEKFYELIG